MSKAICSYPKSEQPKIVARRLASKTKGLGYWSAVSYADYVKKQNQKKEQE